jgi:hypothetical protein
MTLAPVDKPTPQPSGTPHTLTARENTELDRLISQWIPVKNLRPHHRTIIKRIKSLEQGRDSPDPSRMRTPSDGHFFTPEIGGSAYAGW